METCLYHILSRVFADVSKDLGRIPDSIIQVGPESNDECPHKRGGHRQRAKGHMKTEAEAGVM